MLSPTSKPDLILTTQKTSSAWIEKTKTWTEDLADLIQKVIVVSEVSRPFDAPLSWEWIQTNAPGPFQKRRLGFYSATSELAIFFDFDTWMDRNNLRHLLSQTENLSQPTLFRGTYRSPAGTRCAGRAYNELCDMWVKASDYRFLGGAFALWRAPRLDSLWADITGLGGEEQVFSDLWKARGFGHFPLISFFNWHASESSVGWFLRRAYLHGQNKNWVSPDETSLSLKALFAKKNLAIRFWLLLHCLGLSLGAGAFLLKNKIRKAPATLAKA